MNQIIIGITGHRLLSAEETEKVRPVVVKAIENIMSSVSGQGEQASFVAISPLAEGADTLFADAARSLGVALRVLLPFEKDEYLKTFSSDEVRNVFHTIYNDVSPENITLLNTIKGNEMNQLFLDLGERLVNDIDFLVAIWNEQQARGKGGTAEIVAYAIEKKKTVLLINPENPQPYIKFLNPE